AVQSDAFGIIGEGLANAPYLLVEKGNTASVAGVAEDDQAIVASVAGGVLNVKSVLLASGAKVAVYDMSARKVAEAAAPQGASEFNMGLDVAPGAYAVVVYGKGNSETVKVVVK
ncbi:MAG: T9SS type A sorting domain-containing protein, partial [Muribaculaceae bacterium]|nr:T9SS type A sorting domain-containing protein [Muribaculaceae bacterium]